MKNVPIRESISFSFVSPRSGPLKGKRFCSVAVDEVEVDNFEVAPQLSLFALKPVLLAALRSSTAIQMSNALLTLEE